MFMYDVLQGKQREEYEKSLSDAIAANEMAFAVLERTRLSGSSKREE